MDKVKYIKDSIEIKQNSFAQLPIINFFEDKLYIQIHDDKVEIILTNLVLGQTMDDTWDIGSNKAHLKIELTEKSAKPFANE